jgi:hypothetical protein
MFLLDGFVNIGLTASGYNVPLAKDSCLEISIIQSVNNITPVMQAKILDLQGLHAQYNAFADGAPISVNIGPGIVGTPTVNFVRFNMPMVENGHGADLISFSAQLPQAANLRNLQQKSFSKMTSANALQQIAGQLGLPLISDATSDVMTWLPNNRTIGQWMRHVADHGWASAQSAMHLTTGGRGDGNWTMLYKDVVKAAQQSPVVRFVTEGHDTAGDYSIRAAQWRSHSGTLNNLWGYNGITQQVNIQGVVQQFQNVAASFSSGFLDMSSSVKNIVADLPRIFFPRDTGNTHQNYAQAAHQNDRLKTTFSSFLTMLTRDFTNLQVLDSVQAMIYKDDGSLNVTQSGNYLVHSRTQHVSGDNYYELIVLASQGVGAGSGLLS